MIQLALFPLDGPPPLVVTLPDEGIDLYAALRRYQSSLIDQALMRTNGNRAQAARLLRLKRTTLVMMLRQRHSTRTDCQGVRGGALEGTPPLDFELQTPAS